MENKTVKFGEYEFMESTIEEIGCESEKIRKETMMQKLMNTPINFVSREMMLGVLDKED